MIAGKIETINLIINLIIQVNLRVRKLWAHGSGSGTPTWLSRERWAKAAPFSNVRGSTETPGKPNYQLLHIAICAPGQKFGSLFIVACPQERAATRRCLRPRSIEFPSIPLSWRLKSIYGRNIGDADLREGIMVLFSCSVRLLLFFLVLTISSVPALATCNLGGDAKNIASLDFGTLRIAGFTPGSLRILAQQAGSTSDEMRFSLHAGGSRLLVYFGAPGRTITSRMKLKRPITGFFKETFANGNCRRSIHLDDGVLNGNDLSIDSGAVTGNLVGTYVMSGRRFTIRQNVAVVNTRGRTSGVLELEGRQLMIKNSKISIPGAGDTPVAFHADGELELALQLDNLSATILKARLVSDGSASFGSTDLSTNGLRIVSDGMSARRISLNFARQSSLALESVGFDRPILSFSGLGLIKAGDISRSGIARMSGPMHLEAGLPIMDVSGIGISDADFHAGTIEAQNSRLENIFSGEGNIDVAKFASDQMSGSITVDAASGRSFDSAALSATPRSVHLAFSGSPKDPKLRATGELSILQLGSLKLSGGAIGYLIEHALDIINVEFGTAKSGASIAKGQISGTFADGTLRGALSGVADLATAYLVIPQNSFRGRLDLKPLDIVLFGGNIRAQGKRFDFANQSELTFGPDTQAELTLGEADVSLDALQMSPQEGATNLPVQSATVYSGPHAKIGITLNPDAEIPILLTAHFEIPGFSLTFPPIPLEIGSLEVEFTSIKVAQFTIDIWGTTAAISLNGLEISVGQFKPRKLRKGETKVATNLSGKASSPFSILKLAGFFELSPWPPGFSELAVYDLKFGAKDVHYTDTSSVDVHAAQADVAVPHAWLPVEHRPPHKDPYVSVVFSAAHAAVGWHGAPNATADVDRLKIDVRGQPEHLNGSLSLFATTIALSGRAEIPLSTKPDGNNGCTLTVPANVGLSMFDVDGNLDIVDGKPLGQIKVEKFNLGRINYFGHQDCRWDQEASFDVPPYPCEWDTFLGIPYPTKFCTEVKFDIGWVFSVQAVDMHIRPSVIEFQTGDDGKFEACKYSVAELIPIIPPVFSIVPQLPIGGDIARLINDLARSAVTVVYTMLTTAASQLISVISLFDFASHGGGLNVKTQCR